MLKCRWIGTLFVGFIALSVAILAALLLPGQAEAQEQATPKTTTKLVEPGDSLWTIAQARLSPDAAPQQVAEEVGRIYELNRDQIGENPNLIFPGQQFFLVPPAPAGGGRAANTVVPEEPAVSSGEPPTEAQTSVSPPPAGDHDVAWVDDEPPEGARLKGNGDDEWRTVDSDPTPFSGTTAHQSSELNGGHSHQFTGARAPLSINRGERLFAYVYLDPDTVPEEVMLQWNDGSTWEHRAYWGADKIVNVGKEGTESRRYMGPLPPAGEWVRLEVPASEVGLEDREVNGMAFTLWGGRATWDVAGKAGSEAAVAESKSEGGVSQEDALPAQPTPDSRGEEAESAPAESAPATTTRAGGEGIVAAVLEALNDLKGERRLLGVGILALTLIVALLMAWRLPMRRNVGDPQAWGIPQQQYDENYAPAEAPLEAPPETARGPEGEPSGAASGAASGLPPEEATREPTVSSDTGSSLTARGAEEDVVAEGSAVAASDPGRERLRRIRHLRRISQRRSPSDWRGG